LTIFMTGFLGEGAEHRDQAATSQRRGNSHLPL
jgi:hypothetical protein